MIEKINRFYNDIPNSPNKALIDADFDSIEALLETIESDLAETSLQIVHTPLEEALKTRVQAILYQQKMKSKFLLRGIITELNTNNYIALLPLVRSFYEVAMILGYLAQRVKTTSDIKELLEGPIIQLFLGNKNKDTGPFAIGNVESVNIITAIGHVEKKYKTEKDEQMFTNIYSDLSNKCHPNFNSVMYLCALDDNGKLMVLNDVGKSEEQLKSLAYHEYMQPLQIAIEVFNNSVAELSS